MLHLLKIEWLKLKNYRAFWILLTLYLVGIVGANGIVYSIINQIRREASRGVGNLIPSFYSFPDTWNATAFVSSFLFLFPGLLLITHSCNEFSFKTGRQNIIDGIDRKKYISVKLILAVILSALATLIVFLSGLIYGLMASGSLNNFTEDIYYLFYFFLQTLAYSIVAVFVAHWIRRSGLAIGIYFAYSLILENIITTILFWTLLKYYDAGEYSQIFPLQSSDALIKWPGIDKVFKTNTLPDYALIIITCGYIFLFSWLTYRRFVRKDI